MLAAAVQLNSTGDKEANLENAINGIEMAGGAGAELVVLPEYTDYLGPSKDAERVADVVPGPMSGMLAGTAKRLGITLVVGIWERAGGEQARLYNTVLVFDGEGALVARYRKLHMFWADLAGMERADESGNVTPGHRVVTARPDGWHMGVATCFDLRFPEVFRIQALAGCRILVVPSAFRMSTGRDHWEVLLRARAIENQCYVVAANQVGVDGRGVTYLGRSMIVDPWGIVVACAPDEPGYVMAPIDVERQERIRRSMPVLGGRRPDVYEVSALRGVEDRL